MVIRTEIETWNDCQGIKTKNKGIEEIISQIIEKSIIKIGKETKEIRIRALIKSLKEIEKEKIVKKIIKIVIKIKVKLKLKVKVEAWIEGR